MSIMKTLILYLDALGFDFINEENTPFLYKYGKNNSLIKLKTLLGYTGIENAFITGKTPNETGIWTEFIYEKNNLGYLLKFIPLPNSALSYIYALTSYLKGYTFLSKLHNIPRKYFNKFNSSIKEGLWKRDYFQNKTFVYSGWPFFVVNNKINLDFIKRNDDYKVKKFINSFNENIDLYFIHTVDLDKTMHEFGTKHENSIKEIKKQDYYASLIVDEFQSKFKDSRIIIWSDHGFKDIKNFVNIKELVRKYKNTDYFLDSTLARFWFKDLKEKENLIKDLNRIPNGHILNLNEKSKYNIPLGKEYGEVIFAVDSGCLILPNFYQGFKPVKGMHGYMPDKADIDAFFIINKKINKKVLNMHEVLPFLENADIQLYR